ncbi:MAG: glutamine-hydrolyzing carbamoyl-phosphate synthase small subunit [Chloroflexi bacterium]|nr:glutamine-hydrolyzing carbamoyl-phosphate synthase small subunit [Chloroflexota bacterium]
MTLEHTARLVLEDGSIWWGTAFGAGATRLGEVVFNTSMTGYQEILTDPSYAGQIVVMTAPQIGNTGINPADDEAREIFLSGFVVRELSGQVSNWRAHSSLSAWLAEQGCVGISGLDTRALTRRLRDSGTLKGILTTDPTPSDQDLVQQARGWAGLDGVDLVQAVSCDAPYKWAAPSESAWEFATPTVEAGRFHVVAYDFGIKRNILRRLAAHGCRVTVVPAATPANDVLALHPDGVFLSNGPGDPAGVPYAVEAVQALLGRVPLFGICLGHQILGLALGGQTYRLKFGHHGGNQPVQHLPTGRVEISAHNHNFAVDAATLPPDVEVTHVNLNDRCCEGMRHNSLPMLSIQYHPEAAPGPHDADPLFAEFITLMAAEKHASSQANAGNEVQHNAPAN